MGTEKVRITVPQFVAMKAAGRKITHADGLRLHHGRAARRRRRRGHPGRRQPVDGRAGARQHAAGHARRDDLPRRDGRPGGASTRWSWSTCRFPATTWARAKAIENAGRILKETRCQAVKLEGGAEQAEVIAALVSAGIPVMAHCGLRPQSVHHLGGYKVQRDEERLLADAKAAEAGRRVRHRAGVHPGGRGGQDHGRRGHSHDRHRRRRRLRRPGAGDQRPAGPDQRLRAAVRQAYADLRRQSPMRSGDIAAKCRRGRFPGESRRTSSFHRLSRRTTVAASPRVPNQRSS